MKLRVPHHILLQVLNGTAKLRIPTGTIPTAVEFMDDHLVVLVETAEENRLRLADEAADAEFQRNFHREQGGMAFDDLLSRLGIKP